MLRIVFLSIILISQLFSVPPSNFDNIAKNKDQIEKIEKTTFTKIDRLFDGVISNEEQFSITGEKNKNNNVVLKLTHPFYIREIKVFIDKNNKPANVIARFSKNTDYWHEFEDIEVKDNNDSIIYTINGENNLANYISIVFATNSTDENEIIRVQEIEIYPQTEIRMKERYVKDNWYCTDRECFNNINTKIDTKQFFKFNEVGAQTKFNRRPATILEGELIAIGNLLPGTAYEYKMSVTDYNGNMLDLEPRRFSTKPQSYAYNKKTEGTFNSHFDGSPIKDGENPITNGSTDQNEGLAISGSIKGADQYIIIDLEQTRTIREVVTIWRNNGHSKNYSIEVSNDKKEWTMGAIHQNAGTVTPSRTQNGHPIRVVPSKIDNLQGRYIKLLVKKGSEHFLKGSSGLQVFEIKVF